MSARSVPAKQAGEETDLEAARKEVKGSSTLATSRKGTVAVAVGDQPAGSRRASPRSARGSKVQEGRVGRGRGSVYAENGDGKVDDTTPLLDHSCVPLSDIQRCCCAGIATILVVTLLGLGAADAGNSTSYIVIAALASVAQVVLLADLGLRTQRRGRRRAAGENGDIELGTPLESEAEALGDDGRRRKNSTQQAQHPQQPQQLEVVVRAMNTPEGAMSLNSGRANELIEVLETPYQRSVKLLNAAISSSTDQDVIKQLVKIKDLLADPDEMHTIKNGSIHRMSIDSGTREYLEHLLQTPNLGESTYQGGKPTKQRWKKLKVQVAVSNALKAAAPSIDDQWGGTDLLNGSLRDLESDLSSSLSNSHKALPCSALNVPYMYIQQKVHQLVQAGDLIKDPNDASVVEIRDLLQGEGMGFGSWHVKLPILPKTSKDKMEKVHAHMQDLRFLSWDFNLFELEELSEGHSLWFAVMSVFSHFNFIGAFNIGIDGFSAMLLHVEQTYCFDPEKPNRYHTHIHAADVTLTVAHFCEVEIITKQLQGNCALSLLFAAIFHDYRHPGVNNGYLVKKFDPLSILYNDQSVLENFHASEGFKIILDPKYAILTHSSPQDFKAFRMNFIKCILATDLAHSFELISKFQSAVGMTKPFETSTSQTLLLQMILKVADVAHPAKPWVVHRRWSDLVTEEFFLQGDLEAAQQLPISPLCDRSNNNLPKSQVDFIEFVVRPCVTLLSSFCLTTLWTDQLNTNFKTWKKMLDQQEAEKNAKAGT